MCRTDFLLLQPHLPSVRAINRVKLNLPSGHKASVSSNLSVLYVFAHTGKHSSLSLSPLQYQSSVDDGRLSKATLPRVYNLTTTP